MDQIRVLISFQEQVGSRVQMQGLGTLQLFVVCILKVLVHGKSTTPSLLALDPSLALDSRGKKRHTFRVLRWESPQSGYEKVTGIWAQYRELLGVNLQDG